MDKIKDEDLLLDKRLHDLLPPTRIEYCGDGFIRNQPTYTSKYKGAFIYYTLDREVNILRITAKKSHCINSVSISYSLLFKYIKDHLVIDVLLSHINSLVVNLNIELSTNPKPKC